MKPQSQTPNAIAQRLYNARRRERLRLQAASKEVVVRSDVEERWRAFRAKLSIAVPQIGTHYYRSRWNEAEDKADQKFK